MRRHLAESRVAHLEARVIEELGRVRQELGWPIVMTPFSQIVLTQAVMNVTGPERYAVIPDEVIRYAHRPLRPAERADRSRRHGAHRSAAAHARAARRAVMAPLAELRRRLGGRLSDEEFLLRATMPAGQVDAMLAAGPAERHYDPSPSPDVADPHAGRAPRPVAGRRREVRLSPRTAPLRTRERRGTNVSSRPAGGIAGYMFDVDGTLLLSDRSLGGYELLPGAVEVLSALKDRSVPYVLLTNGSAYPPADQSARLRTLGLPVEEHQMLTPSSVTADHMARNRIRRALVLGTRGVGHALVEAGVETTYTGEPRATEVDAVYVGWHPECGMKDIDAAAHAIWGGAKLYVASDVPFFATKQGRMIGYTFAIVAAVRRLTRARAILTGKPSLHALRFVAGRLGVPMRPSASSATIRSSRPSWPIAPVRPAFGVTTGTTSRESGRASPRCDVRIASWDIWATCSIRDGRVRRHPERQETITTVRGAARPAASGSYQTGPVARRRGG